MNWQTIVNEKNLDISVVKLSDIEGLLRIEAEFYNLPFLNRRKILLSKRTQKLDDIAKLTSGPAYSSNTISDIFDENSIPIVRIGDITNKRPVENLSHLNKKEFEKFGSQKVDKLDILMTMTGDPPDVGKCNMWQAGDDQDLAFNQRVCRISAKKGMSAFVLFAYLSTEYSRSFAERYAMGIRQRNVSIKDIKNIPVVYFPAQLTEMLEKDIKSHLDLLESSKEKYREAELLLLKEINLTDYKPSDKNTSVRSLAECLAGDRFDAEYWQPKYDELKQKLQTKKSVPLEKVFDLIGHPTQSDYAESGNIPVIAQKHLGPELTLKSTDFDNLTSHSLIKKTDKKYILKDKDVLVCSAGAPGQTVLWRDRYAKEAIGGSFITILRGTDFIPEYVALYLASLPGQMQFQQYQTASVQQYVYPSQIKKILIPNLRIDVQKELAEKVLNSHQTKEEAKNLLEKAKRAVEIFIEQDEKQALAYLNK
jgi:restriction endonuclease S subunit